MARLLIYVSLVDVGSRIMQLNDEGTFFVLLEVALAFDDLEIFISASAATTSLARAASMRQPVKVVVNMDVDGLVMSTKRL